MEQTRLLSRALLAQGPRQLHAGQLITPFRLPLPGNSRFRVSQMGSPHCSGTVIARTARKGIATESPTRIGDSAIPWMATLNKCPWPLHLVGGLIVGVFVGCPVLPQLMPRKAALVTAAESASQRVHRANAPELQEATSVPADPGECNPAEDWCRHWLDILARARKEVMA